MDTQNLPAFDAPQESVEKLEGRVAVDFGLGQGARRENIRDL
jgi:hypothetical protein